MSEVKPAKQEILELVSALKALGKCGAAVLADKKVDLADLPHLIALAQDNGVILEGVKGLDDVKLKELSMDDMVEIILALVQAVKEVKAA